MLVVERTSLTIQYWRYSATGNTFLMFDNREPVLRSKFTPDVIQKYCDLHKTDGVIFLESSDQYDFHMCYINRDGGEVEMCGNGTRAITHFAFDILKIPFNEQYTFSTFNSVYTSKAEEFWPVRMAELKEEGLHNIDDLFESTCNYFANTGVPHCCFEVSDPQKVDLIENGRRIRYHDRFPKGTNVNFFSHEGLNVVMRTYERGVEGETLSCGTGAAAVVVTLLRKKGLHGDFLLKVPGGDLVVKCSEDGKELWLAGPVEITDSGTFDL